MNSTWIGADGLFYNPNMDCFYVSRHATLAELEAATGIKYDKDPHKFGDKAYRKIWLLQGCSLNPSGRHILGPVETCFLKHREILEESSGEFVKPVEPPAPEPEKTVEEKVAALGADEALVAEIRALRESAAGKAVLDGLKAEGLV